MKKPDFKWKWNTSQDKLVLSDFARYLVHINHQLKEDDEGFEDAYAMSFKPLLADYKNGKLTQLRHGNNLATYVDELEQYLPKSTEINSQDEVNKALRLMRKLKFYLEAYDDGLVNADDMILCLRKVL